MIDLGVDSIIFHHSHIAGHIEIYKEKPIFYGIGNWAASRSKFLNQKLHYPEICNKQLAVEINNGFKVHVCEHKDHNKIEYIKTVSKENLKEFAAPFTNYSDKDYIKWYIKNRRQSFLLPFFSINDGKLMTFFKKFWIRLRQFMIAFLVFIRFKPQSNRQIMNKIANLLYPKLPVFMQNIACTIYGYLEKRKRFNLIFHNYMEIFRLHSILIK